MEEFKYPCKGCGGKFRTQGELEAHDCVWPPNGPPLYICPGCGAGVYGTWDARMHKNCVMK